MTDPGTPRTSMDYCAFGLRIASELALPEFVPCDAHAIPRDVVIKFQKCGSSRRKLPPELLQFDGDDVVLTIEKVARYRVRRGRFITIEAFDGATGRNIRLFLLGSAFGILFHQRGLLPLHAAAILVDGGAIAFAGHAGIGKSTLAAHFLTRGFEVLCDDICVTSFDADGRPMAWPGPPHLKLWRDSAERLGHDCDKLQRIMDDLDKYRVPRAAMSSIGPFPLTRVYHLSDLEAGKPAAIGRLHGSIAVQAIMANTYRQKYLHPMGLSGANLRHSASVARHARIFAAPRRRGIDLLQAESTRLENHVTIGN